MKQFKTFLCVTLPICALMIGIWGFNARSMQPVDLAPATGSQTFSYPDAINGVWAVGPDNIKVGRGLTGTGIARIQFSEFTFAGGTSVANTVPAVDGSGYRITAGWKTNSAGATAIVSLSGTTLTATASTGTTGTLDVMITYLP